MDNWYKDEAHRLKRLEQMRKYYHKKKEKQMKEFNTFAFVAIDDSTEIDAGLVEGG